MTRFALYVLMIVSTPAAAEVVTASSNGFETRYTVDMPLSPAAAYQTFLDLGAWWDPAHTYSGDARNLTLQAVPGGCFCEGRASLGPSGPIAGPPECTNGSRTKLLRPLRFSTGTSLL